MENIKFEVKTKDQMDGRKRAINDFNTRVEAVKAVGFAISPKMVSEMKIGKWYGFRKDVQVRIIEA
jgi:hypothetical protein